MITKPTVFVLGAGASIPYGFPSGLRLLEDARQAMNPGSPINSVISEAASRKGLNPNLMKKLDMALRDTLSQSLDAVLEHREEITEIGKVTIAAILLDYELKLQNTIGRIDDHWIHLIFEETTRGVSTLDEFVENKVKFVTYNYDRVLEYKLIRGLAHKFGRTAVESAEVLAKIPIVHVHGSLGKLPEFKKPDPVAFGGTLNSTTYDVDEITRSVDAASKSIIVIHEGNTRTAELSDARGYLNYANRVVFLGFGYGETNITRLEPATWNTTDILGSAFDLTESERRYKVQSMFTGDGRPNVILGQTEWGCKAFLRNNFQIFRD